MELIEKAKKYAIKCHKETNHLYGNESYEVHLRMVVAVAEEFKHLIPKDKYKSIIAGCWVHDVIEDCRQSYNDVLKATNIEVAEYAYALTNEKGKNRHERANDKYYEGILKTPYATFIKLCDRIANIKHSKQHQNKMFKKYRDENDTIKQKLWNKDYIEMFNYMADLVKENSIPSYP